MNLFVEYHISYRANKFATTICAKYIALGLLIQPHSKLNQYVKLNWAVFFKFQVQVKIEKGNILKILKI